MDPTGCPRRAVGAWLPRTRGDGPRSTSSRHTRRTASPHTRGWTGFKAAIDSLRRGFPAHAGMDRRERQSPRPAFRLPRTRGDGPCPDTHRGTASKASPHTRGWTSGDRERRMCSLGFPAHAGMDRSSTIWCSTASRLPRTRGDGPLMPWQERFILEASPHTRGWTRRRIDDDAQSRASPHTRGWTLETDPASRRNSGFPAHAGMDLGPEVDGGRTRRLPRTRGDGPVTGWVSSTLRWASPHTRGWTLILVRRRDDREGFPAHAGMDPFNGSLSALFTRLPRTRGDGPCNVWGVQLVREASPHTRGWTLLLRLCAEGSGGFPAHAGMDPARHLHQGGRRRLPRTRGDGPQANCLTPSGSRASPHTRGWTVTILPHPNADRGFPAHAGMDPHGSRTLRRAGGLPRTRGDGPFSRAITRCARGASPHTRGWTRCPECGNPRVTGFPAHAGMDPGRRPRRLNVRGLPRTRGDGPNRLQVTGMVAAASPHTRGWTRIRPPTTCCCRGFPAHAGMDPSNSARSSASAGLPRTRGDGPASLTHVGIAPSASPHTRGWTTCADRRDHQ